MASPCSATKIILLAFLVSSYFSAYAGDFNRDFVTTWGNGRAKIVDNGQMLTLSLDRASGSGFRSKHEYLFGNIDMQLLLVRGDSAGTVTTYYLQSRGSTWDEIDLEFLGNLSGRPYILHTNIYTQGKGNREQQFYLWFDPTRNFHTYSILWNPHGIILSVDGTPIREFKNYESKGVPFPMKQPMRIYGTLWDAENWATRGGLVKTNWSAAPFTATFRNFRGNACVWPCGTSCSQIWLKQDLDRTAQERLRWVQKHYMIYNYCADTKRFPRGLPLECTISRGM